MKTSFTWLVVVVLVSACTHQPPSTEGIETLLNTQKAAWNQGNLEGFMQGYWKSDSLCFIGKNGPSYGWDATLQRYKQGYPNKAAMGQLEFDQLQIEAIETHHARCTGQWQLFREADTLRGHFTLILKNMDGQWTIIYDHSS